MAHVNLPFQAGKITGLDAISFSSFYNGPSLVITAGGLFGETAIKKVFLSN